MNECDIISIQEHWLFHNEICLLEQKIGNVNVFGVSPMDNKSLLVGRPHGGCAIMYSKSMSTLVTQIETGNPRICAGILKVSNSCSILLICIYMPCDSNNRSDDLYVSVLDDIRVLCTKFNDINYVMIGSDFNTDFSRQRSYHTEMLNGFCENDDFVCSSSNLILDNEFTYENSTCGRSFIDNFLLTENLVDCISDMKVIHDGDNLSDHCPVSITCNININMTSASMKSYPYKHASKPL
jgi:exonuclease III